MHVAPRATELVHQAMQKVMADLGEAHTFIVDVRFNAEARTTEDEPKSFSVGRKRPQRG